MYKYYTSEESVPSAEYNKGMVKAVVLEKTRNLNQYGAMKTMEILQVKEQ